MRQTAIWTYTAAVVITLLAIMALGAGFRDIFHRTLNGKPLPAMTTTVAESYRWEFVVGLLWLGAAIWLSRRDACTTDRVLAFAATSTLAVVFLWAYTAIALMLPLITIIQPLG